MTMTATMAVGRLECLEARPVPGPVVEDDGLEAAVVAVVAGLVVVPGAAVLLVVVLLPAAVKATTRSEAGASNTPSPTLGVGK
jgi:hypothetical protein